MKTLLITIMLICIFYTFLIDITQSVDEIYNMVLRWFGMKKHHDVPKPLGCSLCMSWWTALVFIIFTNQFDILNITIAIVFASVIPHVVIFLYDLLQLIINKLIGLLR